MNKKSSNNFEKKEQLSDRVKEHLHLKEVLERLDYEGKPSGRNYMFPSPFNTERTPSFAVHKTDNVFKNYGGEGEKGNIIDFGVKYFGSVSAFYNWIRKEFPHVLNTPATSIADIPIFERKKKEPEPPDLKVIETFPLWSFALKDYLTNERKIKLNLAEKYACEVVYENRRQPGSRYFAIGFKNNSGGYALRNKHVKQATFPSDITLIDNGSKNVVWCEGFIDFFSYLQLYHDHTKPPPNYLVMNSNSFIEKALTILQKYDNVYNYLNNDDSGDDCAHMAKELMGAKHHDRRGLYQEYNDMNDRLTGKKKQDVEAEKKNQKKQQKPKP